MRTTRALNCEELEKRLLRADVGLPWHDPMHLTLSFAPDGTQIAGDSSDLFQTIDAQFPTAAAWEGVITQAFQTRVAEANISVGVVADDGAPFGVAGLMQGDPGFGDIRIGARPMSPDVYAITVPPNPYVSGTLSGDVILNSAADLNSSDLFDVVLHEAGLSLGLLENTDTQSVMYPVLNQNAASHRLTFKTFSRSTAPRRPIPTITPSPLPTQSPNRCFTPARLRSSRTAISASRIPISIRFTRRCFTPVP